MNSYLFLFVALFAVCTAAPTVGPSEVDVVHPETVTPPKPEVSPTQQSLESIPTIDSQPSVEQPPLLPAPDLGAFTSDDQFYSMFKKRDDPKHMLYLALSWDARKQMDHFHYLKSALEVGQYAQKILEEAQKSIKNGLQEANYTKDIPIEKFIEETYKLDENITSDDQELSAAVKKLLEKREECMQKLAAVQAQRAQLETAQDSKAVGKNLENVAKKDVEAAVNENIEAVANNPLDNVVAA